MRLSMSLSLCPLPRLFSLLLLLLLLLTHNPHPPQPVQGRMYGGGKGIADSALPYKRTPPSWLKVSSGEVEDHGTWWA